MPKIKIHDLHMTANGNMVSVSWSDGKDFRFHVWLAIDRGAYQEPDQTIGIPASPYRIREGNLGYGQRYVRQVYKNPVVSKKRGSETRYLDADGASNRATVAEALRRAEAEGLYQQAVDAIVTAEKAKEEQRNRAIETGVHVALEALRGDLRDCTAEALDHFLHLASGAELRALYRAIHFAKTDPN